MDIVRTIKDVLSDRTYKRIENSSSSYVHAAVLIPLLDDGGVPEVLFTKRTDKVEHHKGQISFPGGAVDDGDGSFEDTALREAHEEIGLRQEDVEILGRIDDTLTLVSSFVVHPVVGFVPNSYDFVINRVEVKRIIKVPLYVFHPENPQYQRGSVEYEGMTYRAIAYEYNDDVIWGATARMMENFMNILGHKLDLP
ncbi:MAG: CoA pyrophosphatase, partial [Deltaproteobacteria bacterium]|nr:CoA pyrophosphatase [Deltaproteobacteria bacterium]